MSDSMDWLRGANDTLGNLEVKAKFNSCLEILLKSSLERDTVTAPVKVSDKFPKITGSLKDWIHFAENHPNYNPTLRNIEKEYVKLDGKDFHRKGFSPQRQRLQRNMIVAAAAEIYLQAIITKRDQDNLSSAAKWAIEKQIHRHEEVSDLIREVEHGEQVKIEQPAPKVYIPKEFQAE